MFLKLFKYDFLAIIKKIVYYYIVLVAVAIFAKIVDLILQNTRFHEISNLTGFLYFMILVVGLLVALVLCMVRYYKNMLSDQGYLTHTLPVKRSQILLAKLLATLAIEFITIIVMLISIMIYSFDILYDIVNFVRVFFVNAEINSDTYHIVYILLFAVLLLIIQGVYNVAYVALCLTLGACHNKNKLAMAFVYYMGINFALQILSIVGSIVLIILIDGMKLQFSWGLLYGGLTLICLFELILVLVAYFVHLTFLNRKLNLQ